MATTNSKVTPSATPPSAVTSARIGPFGISLPAEGYNPSDFGTMGELYSNLQRRTEKGPAMRKLLGSLGIVALMAMPALAATKATVQQLDALLFEMHQQNKSDGAVAEKLKDLELSEQL